MTWEEKFLAIKAISPEVCLMMRKREDWYVLARGVNRREKHVISGGGISGGTPEIAVERFWEWATDERYHLSVNYAGSHRELRWNGFMWEDVPQEAK